MAERTPGPWKPGHDRVIVLDMRDGHANRKRMYTIEAHIPGKRSFTQEYIFCRTEADRDYVLQLTTRLRALEAENTRLREALGQIATDPALSPDANAAFAQAALTSQPKQEGG